jgi:hypothetical protein
MKPVSDRLDHDCGGVIHVVRQGMDVAPGNDDMLGKAAMVVVQAE